MKNLKIMMAGLVGATLFSGVQIVHADDDTGFYIGASANRVSANFEDENDVNFDDSDTAYGVKAGMMFTDIVGVELAYLDLGDFSSEGDNLGNRIELDADGYAAALVLNWGVLDQLDLYGKAGAFRVSTDSASLVAGNVTLDGGDSTEPFVAVGTELDLGGLNLFAEYSFVDTDVSDLSVDILSAGLKFEF